MFCMFICLRFPVFHGVALLRGATVQLVAHHNELGTMVYNGEAMDTNRWPATNSDDSGRRLHSGRPCMS